MRHRFVSVVFVFIRFSGSINYPHNGEVSDGWPSKGDRIAKRRGGPAIRSTVLLAVDSFDWVVDATSPASLDDQQLRI
jgi:hypothetical protein